MTGVVVRREPPFYFNALETESYRDTNFVVAGATKGWWRFQRAPGAIITPLLRQNDVATSLLRDNDVITSCACWVGLHHDKFFLCVWIQFAWLIYSWLRIDEPIGFEQLTQHPLDKMAAISQTTFSDAVSWMKSFVFWFEFHWRLFLRVQLTISEHWFR